MRLPNGSRSSKRLRPGHAIAVDDLDAGGLELGAPGVELGHFVGDVRARAPCARRPAPRRRCAAADRPPASTARRARAAAPACRPRPCRAARRRTCRACRLAAGRDHDLRVMDAGHARRQDVVDLGDDLRRRVVRRRRRELGAEHAELVARRHHAPRLEIGDADALFVGDLGAVLERLVDLEQLEQAEEAAAHLLCRPGSGYD